MTFRKCIFWLHLTAGVVAGTVVLIMSLTGVLLTYERQILAKAGRGAYRHGPPASGASPMPLDALLAKVREQRGYLPPGSVLTLRADPAEPAEIGGRGGGLYVNRYSGAVLGQGSPGTRGFFQRVTAWHRWLGTEGAGRAAARAITGACNLAFLFLVVSGLYLWFPRKWSRQHVRPVVWFRRGIAGKARDFNWHNTIGVWSLVPLFFVVLTAVPISYPWASSLLYRMTGAEPPAPGGRSGAGAPVREDPGEGDLAGLDRLWTRAAAQIPGWTSIALRIPESQRAPAVFTIDRGTGGQPQKRATLTLDQRTGAIVRFERFEDQNAGRRLRSWARFIHTGEAFGLAGQTVAGIASVGGVVLVWTGIALSLRRMAAWRRRRAAACPEVEDERSEQLVKS